MKARLHQCGTMLLSDELWLYLEQIGTPMANIMRYTMVPAIALIIAISILLFASALKFYFIDP